MLIGLSISITFSLYIYLSENVYRLIYLILFLSIYLSQPSYIYLLSFYLSILYLIIWKLASSQIPCENKIFDPKLKQTQEALMFPLTCNPNMFIKEATWSMCFKSINNRHVCVNISKACLRQLDVSFHKQGCDFSCTLIEHEIFSDFWDILDANNSLLGSYI